MSPPEKILVVSGILNLAYGSLFGFPYAVARKTKEFPSRYLQAAHIGPLMQAAILLGLAASFQHIGLSTVLAFWGAGLLAASSLFLALKDTANWLQGIKDEFRENPMIGKALGAIGVMANLGGVGIVLFGLLSL
ncbi:hypothetical protein LEP1GSC058_2039 [Leptospira fainei serovar Hurstbridge str. BUT 6]|uniref:Uncharacterized protein n=1 Tax=Leptospira fainei serovar Hurstbridge str. BUT 6 TaxID=1193011 RepID=S3W517_9LEPT|nr:hypothetical protein [Leptospira fainei]EPG75347.1 hypothetical protein LEP1GSC058_2039 [Leptospira fainei serovar Hurstbridge str. BUT 6]